MTRLIALAELQSDVPINLTNLEAAALNRSDLVEARPMISGGWSVSARGSVGAVRIGDLDVQVRPKIGINRLVFLLGYAANPHSHPGDAAIGEARDVWVAVAEALARQAERALARGALQGYVTVEDSLPLLRGRIRTSDQLTRHPGSPLPLEVRFDDYTADIAENQILRTAIRTLVGLPRLPVTVRARLLRCDLQLAEATVITSVTRMPRWIKNRLNEPYHSALALSELILSRRSWDLSKGSLRVNAFVVTMATVFENFVTVALAEAWARLGTTVKQYPSTLDEPSRSSGPPIRMKVDLVHLTAGEPDIVVDAKYKREHVAGYPNADYYQLLAYCAALGVRTGWLVYAEGSRPPGHHLVRRTSIHIREQPLDLAAPPAQLLAQIARLADQMLSVRAATHPAAGVPP
jgi:5-methylcytosine-specific restriction enzyme subunit McrC